MVKALSWGSCYVWRKIQDRFSANFSQLLNTSHLEIPFLLFYVELFSWGPCRAVFVLPLNVDLLYSARKYKLREKLLFHLCLSSMRFHHEEKLAKDKISHGLLCLCQVPPEPCAMDNDAQQGWIERRMASQMVLGPLPQTPSPVREIELCSPPHGLYCLCPATDPLLISAKGYLFYRSWS